MGYTSTGLARVPAGEFEWFIVRLEDNFEHFLHPMQVRPLRPLIDWKWRNITRDVGYFVHNGQRLPYDAILPDEYAGAGRMDHHAHWAGPSEAGKRPLA